MDMLLLVPVLGILAACVGFFGREGLWNNAIRLLNVILAGLLATNFFEPVARLLDDLLPSCTFFWDFLSLWLLFAGIMAVLRLLTDQASKFRVRFPTIFDRVGSWALASCIGWVMVCFSFMTLHTAPLPRNFLYGAFQPEQRMVLGLAPDRMWLGFARYESWGPFCGGATREDIFDPQPDDPKLGFRNKYATRREDFEYLADKTSSLRVNP
jgi:hypothetical protein